MAVIIAIVKRSTRGHGKSVTADVTGPASYTNPGGEALTAAQFAQLFGEPVASPDWTKVGKFDSEVESANLRSIVLDKTNGKMKFTVAGAEVANATNLSAVTIRVEFLYGAQLV